MPENAPQANPYGCNEIPKAPEVPEIPKPLPCPKFCDCPEPPGGTPKDCIDLLIQEQNGIVKTAERAKVFAEELVAIQEKMKSAQLDYTHARYLDLRSKWKEQDGAIAELIRKLVCAVCCWQCLLECRLCRQLVEIRRKEDLLYGAPGADPAGTGPLTTQVYSLYDQHAWHERNVAQMKRRLQRITAVMAAWEKPAATLAEVLEKNGNLIKEIQNLISTDPAKALYDVFMTLIPTHWAIRPRGPDVGGECETAIDSEYIRICDCPRPDKPAAAQGGGDGACDGEDDGDGKCRCDDGLPDDCCGPDVGIQSLRQQLIGPLPYIVEPGRFPFIFCCLTTQRLSPASDDLAAAEAARAASAAAIEATVKEIADLTAAIEATFRAELGNPIDCQPYSSAQGAGPGARAKPASQQVS